MAKGFRRLKIAAAAVGLACVLGLLVNHLAAGAATPAPANENSLAGVKMVDAIEGYKDWTKVNPAPLSMAARVAAACAVMIPPGDKGIDGPANPHRNAYYTVFVNEVGRAAMMEQKNPKFPEGSVIVKEKLRAEFSQTVELLTVMIKQRKGFNPEGGDWEYMVVDGSGTKIEGRGKLENCQACHLGNQESDYIFRTYLPYGVAKRLK
jgi:hypothetical protein